MHRYALLCFAAMRINVIHHSLRMKQFSVPMTSRQCPYQGRFHAYPMHEERVYQSTFLCTESTSGMQEGIPHTIYHIPVERPAVRTNKETKQFLCSIAGLWSSLCLRVLPCVGECYHAFSDSVCLITAEPWSNIANERVNTSLSLGIPHTQTKANTDVHVPVVGTMVMSVCQYTHMAISNWSSHFFFSSLVLKNSSKPVCPCWWVT